MIKRTFIVSDLHLGSKYCRADQFMSFLESLPDEAALILNGDTVSFMHRDLTDLHLRILDRLREESFKRDVIWLEGNHDSDRRFQLDNPKNIRFARKHVIDGRIIIEHGHRSDWIRASLLPIVYAVQFILMACQRMGCSPMPSSQYAKRMPGLFRIYLNAYGHSCVRMARRNNFNTVICGHIHHAEDRQIRNVRYINTGSWVNNSVSYVEINNGSVELKEFKGKASNE